MANYPKNPPAVIAEDSQWLKEQILGADYELSVAFIGPARSRSLNYRFRQQDRPASILSFPLSPRSGEILLNKQTARAGAKQKGEPLEKYLIYLLIHGMLHLKGFRHGSKMETTERKFLKKFYQHHAQINSHRP